MRHKRRLTVKWTRDLMVCTVALGSFVFEVALGGGRPSVLTACVALLLSPFVMRVDEARKEKNGKQSDGNDEVKANAAP